MDKFQTPGSTSKTLPQPGKETDKHKGKILISSEAQ